MMKPKRKIMKDSDCFLVEACQRRIRITLSQGKYKEAAGHYNKLGNMYRTFSMFQDALEQHQNEIDTCKNHVKEDAMGLGIAYRNMAEVYIDMKEHEKAVSFINKYLKVAQMQENNAEEQRALITLGRSYLSKADPAAEELDEISKAKDLAKAEQYFRQAYNLLSESSKLTTQLGSEKEFMAMKCNNCQNLGICLETQGNDADATAWLQKAVDIGKKYNLYEYIHPCQLILSSIHIRNGDSKKACTAAEDAVNVAKILDNKDMEIEAVMALAKALISSCDLDAGKNVLKKWRRQALSISKRAKSTRKREILASLKELEILLKIVVRLCRRYDQYVMLGPEQIHKRMKLSEYMADKYAEMGLFSDALKHYFEALKLAELTGVKGKQLTRLHFSIAMTYKDLNNFEKALESFNTEMVLHGSDTVEIFKTQMNIINIMEKLLVDQHKLIEAYKFAISLAKKTKSKRRKLRVLESYTLYLKSINQDNTEESKQALDKIEWIKRHKGMCWADLDDYDVDSQEDVLEDDEVDEKIDLNNLSLDEESDEDDSDKRGRGVKRKVVGRKNEAGETPLHIAAKKGDINGVRKFLRQGLEVNARDTAGWTPLHEAANFGHALVVEELVKHGAKINDRGGQICEGITPLSDALSNGNFDVVEILLKHGADVMVRDDKKLLPLDHLIIWRYSSADESTLQGSYDHYQRVKQTLKDKMLAKGHEYTKKDEQRALKRTKRPRNPSPEFSLLNSSNSRISVDGRKSIDEFQPVPVKIANDTFDPDNAEEAKEMYRSTMNSLMRNNKKSAAERRRHCNDTHDRPISPGPRNALIPSELDVHESWMVNDSQIDPLPSEATLTTTKGRKRTMNKSSNATTTTTTTRGRRTVIRNESDEVEEPPLTPVLPPYDDRTIRSPLMFDDDDDDIDEFPLTSQTASARYECTPCSNSSSSSSNASGASKRKRSSSPPPPKSPVEMLIVEDSSSDSERSSSMDNFTRKRTASSKSKTKSTNEPRLLDRYLTIKTKRKCVPASQQSQLPISGSTSTLQNNSKGSASTAVVVRLRVKILEQTFLIPLDEENFQKSVAWLSDECSLRYERSHGVRPILTLSTADGAHLSPMDPVRLVVNNDDTLLLAQVISYDLPLLMIRFQTACEELCIDACKEIKTAVNICQSTNRLIVESINLRGPVCQALFKSLQRQDILTELCLTGCALFDHGILELSKIIGTLANLQRLNLSKNGMTAVGFNGLSDSIVKAAKEPKFSWQISYLNVNYNPLGNSVGNSLASLISSCSNLQQLLLSSCNFTGKLFLNSQKVLHAITNAKLEDLDMSMNDLGVDGVETLFVSLTISYIRSLNLRRVGINKDQGHKRFSQKLKTDLSYPVPDSIEKDFNTIGELLLSSPLVDENIKTLIRNL